MTIIENILLQALLNFLLLGGAVGLIVGAILIFRPHWLERAGLLVNRWVSTRQLDRKLESSITLDPWFYRYRRASAGLTMLGALYVIYFFTLGMDKDGTVEGMVKHFHIPSAYIRALLDPFVLIALLGATFSLFVSLFVYFRPSALRDFEKGANQWISMRRALKPLEISRSGVDEFAFRHAQQVGVLLVLGSVYILVFLIFWIM